MLVSSAIPFKAAARKWIDWGTTKSKLVNKCLSAIPFQAAASKGRALVNDKVYVCKSCVMMTSLPCCFPGCLCQLASFNDIH